MSQEDLLAKLFENLLAAEESKSSDGGDEERADKSEKTDESNGDGDDIFGGIDIEAVLKLGEILSQMNKTDKNSQLLLALKPHLKPENRKKADNALKLMKIMNILPLLKDSGILDGLF